MKQIYVFLFLVCSLVTSVNAQYTDPKSYDVINARGTITLDGKLDEAAWGKTPNVLVFGPNAPTSTVNLAVTGGLSVKSDTLRPLDTTYTYLKIIKQGMKLYVGFYSNDKQVCKFGDSWEGDGLFMKIVDAGGNAKEYKLYYNASGVDPEMVYEGPGANYGNGIGVKGNGTIVNDSSQVDTGYTAELEVNLEALGFDENTKTVQVSLNIFDPDYYNNGMGAWGPYGAFYKTWWGSEWGDVLRTLHFLDDPDSLTVYTSPSPITVDGNLNEGVWNDIQHYLVFGPNASTTGMAHTVSGGTLVKGPYTDTTYTTVKAIMLDGKIYFGFYSNDKSVCRFGDSWEGDGMFLQIKNASNVTKEFKLYFNLAGADPAVHYEETDPGSGSGAAVKGSSTVVNDTNQVDNGYTAELMVNLFALGYGDNVTSVPVSINIFDPDGYPDGAGAWGPVGSFQKSWWGSEWGSDFRTLALSSQVLAVEDNHPVANPSQFSLSQNYPNPFNPTSTLEFAVPVRSTVTLNIYNTLGQLVSKAIDGNYEAGTHKVNIDASSFSSGVYFYSIIATGQNGEKFTSSRKMVVLK